MPRKAKKPPADPAAQIIDAALLLAAECGWTGLRLGDIFAAAGVTFAEGFALFPGKTSILAAYSARIDRFMLHSLAQSGAATTGARERLFDAIMTRFESMAPERPALARIQADLRRDPLALAALLRPVQQSLNCILETAGLDTTGWRGAARQHGLAALLARVTLIWLADDSADMGATMAALDRALIWAGRLAGHLDRGASGAQSAAH